MSRHQPVSMYALKSFTNAHSTLIFFTSYFVMKYTVQFFANWSGADQLINRGLQTEGLSIENERDLQLITV